MASCGGESATSGHSPPAGNVGSNVITYRLIPAQGPFDPTGSRIDFVTPGLGIPPAPPAPLEGSFDVLPARPAPPNSQVALTITRLGFTGGSSVVSGTTGCIEITTLDVLHPLRFGASVTIDGTSTELTGVGDEGTFSMDSPPTLGGIDLRSGADFRGFYYHLTLFAAPSD
jgi:hypothetical protein